MTDGYIQVPPDQAGGKRVETSELTRGSDFLTVQRQRVEVLDDVSFGGDLLVQLLVEDRITNLLLVEGFGLNDNIDGLREELSDVAGLTIPVVREILTEDRNYYVAKNGNDNNSGLSSDAAFLTIQAGITAIYELDFNGFSATLNVGVGTFTESIAMLAPFYGAGRGAFKIVGTGNTTLLNNDNSDTITTAFASIELQDFKLESTFTGLTAQLKSDVSLTGVEFGVCGGHHMDIREYAQVTVDEEPYTISGGAQGHIRIVERAGGSFVAKDCAITVTGTPAFNMFIEVTNHGFAKFQDGVTFSGAATGQRYNVEANSAIVTEGGGATFFPGNVAGTTSPDGEYT